MNKTDLIERIVRDTNISKSTAATMVESVIAAITDTLKRGGHVTLSGFGTFSTYRRQPRNGRNPQTGALIRIAARRVAKFSPGLDMKKAISK